MKTGMGSGLEKDLCEVLEVPLTSSVSLGNHGKGEEELEDMV